MMPLLASLIALAACAIFALTLRMRAPAHSTLPSKVEFWSRLRQADSTPLPRARA